MTGAARIPQRMSRAEYRQWAEQQTGRYELIDGEPVAMAPERLRHVEVKAFVWRALHDAIQAAGAPCRAYADGVTVEIDTATDYEPDAVIDCGPPPDMDGVIAPNPVVVVEVLSPSTQSVDTTRKLAGYFTVASVVHYLVVDTRQRLVVQHSRAGEQILSRIVTSGLIHLNPPGFSVAIENFYSP